MNKFKKILLGTLSVLTLGLFVVAGTKVNASTKNDTYDLIALLDNTYDAGTTNIAKPSDHGIFKSFVSSKYRFQSATQEWGGTDSDLSAYSYDFQLRNSGAGFSIVIELGEGQSAQLNYVFFAGTSKKLTVGSTELVGLGTSSLKSGSLALTTGTTTVIGTGNVSILKFEVVVSGGTEKQYYDVKYYDSDKTTEFTTKADSVEDGGKVTKPQDPEKLGYTFAKWYNMSNDEEFNFDSDTVSGALNLYASYTPWSNVATLNLNTMGLAKEALGTEKSTDADRTVTGTIYTLLKGNTVMATSSDTVGTLGGSSACIKTGGNFSQGTNGVALTISNPGIITIWAKNGSSGERDFGVYKDGNTSLENVPTGHLLNKIAKYTLSLTEAGTYQIGSTSGSVVLYYISFEEGIHSTAEVYAEKNKDTDTLRFVGTITGITNLADIESIELVLLKGETPTNKQIFLTTCFTSITGTSQYCQAATGTYYVVYRISSISDIAGSTISKKLIVTFTDKTQAISDVTIINV
jgi:uncharacterized repeat protein (TIGR02543 family)